MAKSHAHNWSGRIGWKIATPVCVRCGLLKLRNKASEKAAEKPCEGSEQ